MKQRSLRANPWWVLPLIWIVFSCAPGQEPKREEAACPEIPLSSSEWDHTSCDYPRPLPAELVWFKPLQPFFDSILRADASIIIATDTLQLLDSAIVSLAGYPDEAYHFSKAHLYLLKGELETRFPEKAIADLRRAETWLAKASGLLEDSCYWHYQANLYNRMGIVYTKLADLDNAVTAFQNAIAIRSTRLTGGRRDLAANYSSMGNAFHNAGAFSRAVAWHEKAVCLMSGLQTYTAEDTTDLAWMHNNLGVALGYKADSLDVVGAHGTAESYRNKALGQLRRALATGSEYAENQNLLEAHLYAQLNVAFQFSKRQSPGAADSIRFYVEDCFRLCREEVGVVPRIVQMVGNRHLAYAAMLEGNCAEAVERIDDAIEAQRLRNEETGALLIANKDYYSNFLFSKGAILQRCAGQYPDEPAYLQQSFRAFSEAIAFSEQTRRELATDISLEGFLRPRIFQFARAFEVAAGLYHATGNADYLDSAFQIAERSRSFTLRQGIIRQVLKWQSEREEDDLLTTEFSFRNRILVLKKQAVSNPDSLRLLSALQSEKERFARFVNDLKNSGDPEKRRFYANRFDHSAPSVRSVQEALPDHRTAVVEYMIGADSLWSLALTRDTVMIAAAAIDSSFYTLAAAYAQSLTMDKGPYQDDAWKIYQAVFQRVDEQLSGMGIKNVIIIPDKQLQGVHFEVMLDAPGPAPRAFGDFSYLIRRYNFGYHYSVAGLLSGRRLVGSRPPAPSAFAGFTSETPDPASGYVSCGNTRLAELEHVTEQTWRRYFQGAGGLFTAARARTFRDTAGRYSILQLALHGCSSGHADSEFFLEFHPTPGGEESHLTLPEIYSLDLRSQLAILSNCHTAGGRNDSGEGLISISRAFAYAGCPNTIGALSAVPDRSTAQILEFFYEYLLEEGDPAFIALARAKRKYEAQNDSHPWYWSNLIYIGDVVPLEIRSTGTLE